MRLRYRSINDSVAAVLLIVYFAELIFPKINTIGSYSYICLGCFLLWLFVSYCTDRSFFRQRRVIFCIFIYLYLVITPLIFGYSVIMHRYASFSLILCGSLVYDFYISHGQLEQLKKVIIITLILSIITLIVTYAALVVNPYISRSIKSSGEYSEVLASQGIGGYAFVYYIVALSPIALFLTIKCTKRIYKVFSFLFYIATVAFVIKSNYMTAFLIVVLSSAVLVFVTLSSIGRRGIVYGLLAVIIILVVALNLTSILNAASEFFPARISSVLIDTNGSSVGQSISQEFLGDRWPTMQSSLRMFLKHPFWGALGSGELLYTEGGLSGFGQHSFIFDTFALYGIIGGVLCIVAVYYPFVRNYEENHEIPLKIAMITCVTLLYVFNNATESVALALTIFYPFFRDSYIEFQKVSCVDSSNCAR